MTRRSDWGALALALILGIPSAGAATAPVPNHLQAAHVQADAAVMELAARIVAASDHVAQQAPRSFAIIDKPRAAVSIFDAQGQWLATSPVLLGLAVGDDTVPGIADRPLRLVKPHERTTPAGRFVARPGRNAENDDVVWVDYDSAVSMHRVRTQSKVDRRLERLATPGHDDNRISFGCINVPAAFYDAWIKPLFSNEVGVVYVMPDKKTLAEVFDFLRPASP